jgi:hypothetical protein
MISLAKLLLICASGILSMLTTATSTTMEARVDPKKFVGQIVKTSPQEADTIFSKIKAELLNKTSVPLRLPSLLPDVGDAENPLYGRVQKAEKGDYTIELGWVENCDGGNACHYGTVRGSTSKLVENGGAKVPVKLRGGILGYFIHSTCGAHCDDSAVGWAERGYYYSISIKAADMETLVAVANSAIVVPEVRN